MPFPTLFFLAIAIGIAAALAGGNELRLSPRHALLTSCYSAYAAFLGLLLIPITAYFYVFHGDWFLLYTVDTARVPSAIALLGFLFMAAAGTAAFALGGALARNQRGTAGGVLVAVMVLAGAVVLLVWPERLMVVGTYAQYRGQFGLQPYGGVLMQGAAAMGGYLVLGAVFLLARIRRRPAN